MSRLIATTLVVGCTFVTAAHAQVVGKSSSTSRGGVRAAVGSQSRGVFRAADSDRVVRPILVRIQTDTETLRRFAVPRGTYGRQSTDEMSYLIDDIVAATDHLTDHFNRRQVIQADVEDLIRRGAALEEAINNSRPSQQLRSAWTRLQDALDSLASAYGMTWDWQNPSYSSWDPATGVYQRLTGTYQLDQARSDDPERIADQAMRQVTGAARTRMSRRIQNRLDAPEQIAIERINNRITLASSRAPRVSFEANGQATTESLGGARNVTSRATLYGDRLEIVTHGNADTDFTAIFEPLDSGQSLRVTKRFDSSTVGQPIVVSSVYRRISETPEWTVYDGRGSVIATSGRNTRDDEGVVPDGTTLVATLEQPLNVLSIQQNDRVWLTVRNAPTSALEDAVIEGYVTSVPSEPNSAGLSMAFNQIRLRNGRTSGFDGTVESVHGPNGEPISFNGEVVSPTDSQRDQAIQRGAIGAAVGAVIGAIAGGAKGAAIGAVVGGGGGAATVLIGGQRTTELPRGTEFTIRSRGYSR